ncbi:MAG TPA: glycosyltransferase, partial [Candidatus Acidoferrales bacterium]|nr:glycosyltransferase [Candidatus Acidoferrales bacterium]
MSVIKRIPKTIGCLLARRFVKRIHGRQMHIADGKSFTVNLVSSWDKQCGIATYSAFLAEELRKKAKLSVTPLPQRNPLSPFFFVLGRSVGRSGDVVQVEFEYGLFSSLKLGKKSLTAFASLPFYLGLSYGNRRVVTTIHEPREVVSANRRSGLFYTKLVDKLIFAVSDQIIVHTQKSKQLLETVYGVSEGKLTVIPHGSYQKPLFLDKEECKRKLGLSGKTIVTIMGFVTPKKGHDILIPLLPKLDPNVQLVIAGGPQTVSDEQFLEMLKQLVEQNHCSDRVTFTGYL